MDSEHTKQPRKYRIALWTPLPPLKTGIADYVTELLPHLAKNMDLEIFVDDNYKVLEELTSQYKIFPHYEYSERQKAGEFDLNIYQLGNNGFHIYIYNQALQVPGVVVLHDLSLSYMLYHYHAGVRNDLDGFKNELEQSEGPDTLRQFSRIYNNGDNEAMMEFFSHQYMLHKITGRNYAVVSHLPYCADIVRQRYGAKHVYSMYLGSPDPTLEMPGIAKAEARLQLNIPNEQFVVGVFGHLQPNKQNDVVIRALSKIKAKHPNVLLAFVGEMNRSQNYDQYLLDLTQKLRVEENVRTTGFVTRDDMQKYYIACDVIVNLRYPSFGQMSATLSRGIATGRPAIITDLPEWRFFPETFCWRVPAEDTGGRGLAELVNRLIENPSELEQRGESARDFYLQNGTTEKAAENFQEIIDDIVENVPKEVNLPAIESAGSTQINLSKTAFDEWDSLRVGGRERYFFERLRKIPFVGPPLFGGFILLANVFRIRKLRHAEYVFYKSLSDGMTNLESLLESKYLFEKSIYNLRSKLEAETTRLETKFETETTRLREETREEYKAEPMRIWNDPLGNIPGYQRPQTNELSPESAEEIYYISFENAFRGPVEIIRNRQKQIIGQIKSYVSLEEGARILDVGCGRGEFLSLLRDEGVQPIGVDTNRVLIEQLQQKGFEAHASDVFEYLTSLPDNSLKGITAFHVIEHLTHQQNMALFSLAYKKLARGGFIYLETPNPLCPDSLGRFYTDPTHVRPIQPFQLSFMLEYNQFVKLRALFLEPVPTRGSLASERWITLYQDFGVLALKENE